MFDIGWSEMALILAVALVVIGPKDLPRLARQIGRWSAKARSMAREFQRSLDDMAREAELQDIKAEIEKASRGASGLGAEIERTVDPDGDLRRSLEPPRIEPPRFGDEPKHHTEPEPAKVLETTVEPVAAANAGEPPAVPTAQPAAHSLPPQLTDKA
jgi:sec-independent protein translocase protein TatB